MPTCKTFDSLLQSGKPRCGQIRDAQRDYLFGKDSIEIGSVALTPLGRQGSAWACWRSAQAMRTASIRP